jgi:hypothetical protein
MLPNRLPKNFIKILEKNWQLIYMLVKSFAQKVH